MVQETLRNIINRFQEICGEKNIKGLVHPKMKIKSLITHPHAVPTP